MTALHTLIGQGGGHQINDLKLINTGDVKYTDEFSQVWFKAGYTEVADGTYPDASKTTGTASSGSTSTLFTASQVVGNPTGIVFDSDTYYIMDSSDYTIKVYNSSFVYQTSFGTTSGPNTASPFWTVAGTKVLVTEGTTVYEYNTSGTYIGTWSSTWAQGPDGAGTLAYASDIDALYCINTTGAGGDGELYSLSNTSGVSADIGTITSFTSNGRQSIGLSYYNGEIHMLSHSATERTTEMYRTSGYAGPSVNAGVLTYLAGLSENNIDVMGGLAFNGSGFVYVDYATKAVRLVPVNDTVGIGTASTVGGVSYYVRVG